MNWKQNTKHTLYTIYTICTLCLFAVMPQASAQNENPAQNGTAVQSEAHVGASEAANVEFMDKNARMILENSIQTLLSSQNYAVENISFEAQIHGQNLRGRGAYYQKRTVSAQDSRETFFARWQMSTFSQTMELHQLSVLNGEQMKLWLQNDFRKKDSTDAPPPLEIMYINLNTISRSVSESPESWPTLSAPWFTQPRVEQLLQGILDSFQFTMVGRTRIPSRDKQMHQIYQIQGTLKPELAKKILEKRRITSQDDPIPLLPSEIPTYVEIFIDQTQWFPHLIRFHRTKEAEEPEFFLSIWFENNYLNNATLYAGNFEVTGNNIVDITETFLKDHQVTPENASESTEMQTK